MMLNSPIKRYNISLHLVAKQDAQFIVDLRLGGKNIHISATDPDVDKQISWIARYKQREADNCEYYFIVKDNANSPWGTTRLYNFEEKTFDVGSWVFLPGAPAGIAIKADIIAREIAFEELGFTTCRFDVRKDNKSVLRYHNGYGPKVVGEDELSYHFELDKASFYNHRDKLLKLIA